MKEIYIYAMILIIAMSGIILLFLIFLIYYQIKFISQDTTTSEYLRSDKYQINFFDEGWKLNFKKFFENKYSYSNNFAYNDSSKEAIKTTRLISEYQCFIKNINLDKETGDIKNTLDDNLNQSLDTGANGFDPHLEKKSDYFKRLSQDSKISNI